MRLPRAGGWPSVLRVLGILPAEARWGRGVWWVEDGVGRGCRGCRARTLERSGGRRFPAHRVHQLAQLAVFFVSPGFVEGVLLAVAFVGLLAVLFRVALVVFFVVVCRWCAVPSSEVLSAKRSAVFESLGASGAVDPHVRGSEQQWTFPAGRFVVAVDCDMDVNLQWVGI